MSAFALKLVALISMFIDHSAFVLYMHNFMNENIYILLRGIGRLAFPIYCFLLVNGFMHTSNRLRYVSRLMLFAVISQIPFALAFNVGNHYGAAFGTPEISFGSITYILLAFQFILAAVVCKNKKVSHIFTLCLFAILPALTLSSGTVILLDGNLNVFFTLSLGLSLISLIDAVKEKKLSAPAVVLSSLAILGAVILIQSQADYGITGLVLILLLYLCRSNKLYAAIVICLWAAVQYGFTGANLVFFAFAALSLLPVLIYNGKKGPSLKYFFYIFYPAHLLLLGIAGLLL